MQIATATPLRGSSGVLGRSNASIEMNAVAFKMLSSGLYSDKIAAPLREIGCNAADAHVMAGTPNRPFEVKLPTVLSPDLSIRDYGPGLSHDDVMENYQRYFHSTKRQDTETVKADELIGCLGLGSKSPRAYADQFTVRSSHGGTVRTYVCCDDESGVPGVNMMLMEPAPDDWQHGLEVSFPVSPKDFEAFRKRAAEVFRWFRVAPINVATGQPFDSAKPDWVFGNFRHYEGYDDWNTTRNGAVLMGNVLYKLDYSQILKRDGSWVDQAVSGIFQQDLVIDVAIGTVEVTASRETIEYTPRTIHNLRGALEQEVRTIAANVEKYFDEHPDISLAGYQTLINELLPAKFVDRIGYFKPGLQAVMKPEAWAKLDTALYQRVDIKGWQGIIEECDQHHIPPPTGVIYRSDANGKRKSQLFTGSIPLDSPSRVVINDKPLRWKDRLSTLMKEAPGTVFVVLSTPRPEDTEGLYDILNDNYIPIEYELLSGRPKPPPKAKGQGGGKRTPEDRTVGAFDLSAVISVGYGGGWEPPQVRIGDITDRYYLVREASWGRRSLCGFTFRGRDPGDVVRVLKGFQKVGLPCPGHLAIVTWSDLSKKKLEDLGFKPLGSWVNDVLMQDPQVIAYKTTQVDITSVHYNPWYDHTGITHALYTALFDGGPEAALVRQALTGSNYLVELEALLTQHREFEVRMSQTNGAATRVQQTPVYQALMSAGIQPMPQAQETLDIRIKAGELQDRYPLLRYINNGRSLPDERPDLNFLLAAVALAVAPAADIPTAEENS